MSLQVNDTTTIYGDRVELTFNNKPLAFGKSCSLEITAETLDTSNKMSGDWKEFLVSKLSFTVSSDALLTYSDTAAAPDLANVAKFGDLLTTWVKRTPIAFSLSKITKVEGGGFSKDFDLVTGRVIITSLRIQADDGQIATCSIQLQGTGELSIGDKFKGKAIDEGSAE